jgi:hypothetical protein
MRTPQTPREIAAPAINYALDLVAKGVGTRIAAEITADRYDCNARRLEVLVLDELAVAGA